MGRSSVKKFTPLLGLELPAGGQRLRGLRADDQLHVAVEDLQERNRLVD
jgi:hypothetical protein